VAVQWRRLHIEELYTLYSSPNVIQFIKSRTIRLAGHVTHMGKKERSVHGFGVGDLRARDHLKDMGVDGRVNMQELSDRDTDWSDLAQSVEW